MKKVYRPRPGFTLIELLVVITILAMLAFTGFMSYRRQIDKANDSLRKDDLQRLSTSFEDYYNDHNCYPPADILDNCSGEELKPYLSKIPCDPVTRQPYFYVVDDSNPACFRNFRIVTHLDNESDTAAADLGYDENYNYGVASTNVSATKPGPASPSPSPFASRSPSPSPSSVPLPPGYSGPGSWGCQALSTTIPPYNGCNSYGSDANAAFYCPKITFNNGACDNACFNPIYKCND
jgi:general secretion pathway protein G